MAKIIVSAGPPRIKLYLRHSFSAAHHLPNYNGPCSKLHGHNFIVEVWIEGVKDKVTGMVVDFRWIKRAIDLLDHENLNKIPYKDFRQPPTAENIAEFLLLQMPFRGKVRVWESEDSYAEASNDT